MHDLNVAIAISNLTAPAPLRAAVRDVEAARALSYPLARWYLRPLAGRLAARLADTAVRPWHVTLAGFACASAAAGLLLWQPALTPWTAVLALAWWFCDRTDGMLARRQGTSSRLGAWLDGNLDELVDLGLHLAMAHVAASQGSRWAWPLVVAFVFGKYLLMHSVAGAPDKSLPKAPGNCRDAVTKYPRIARFFHLPGNADVRAHLMIVALATGWITAELALIAVYYNIRWLARYPLEIARGGRDAG